MEARTATKVLKEAVATVRCDAALKAAAAAGRNVADVTCIHFLQISKQITLS